MNGRLGLFEYIYKEDLAVSADGETPETHHKSEQYHSVMNYTIQLRKSTDQVA